MNTKTNFFEFAAEVGLTKHIGGVDATEKLVGLCHIDRDKVVLDVGCGAGVTPCFIARKYGCKVVGVDILQGMIEKSRERAEMEKITHLVEFRVADAQELPFDDGMFDAVITESVTALTDEKQKAVNEYARVIKQGGYVGLNESTWLKTLPPPDVVAWVSQDIGSNVEPLAAEAWVGLLENAGFSNVTAKALPVNVRDETRGIFQRYGCLGMLGVYWRILLLYLRSPSYRKFLKEIQGVGTIPEALHEYFGYGLFVGKK